jgi:16S rRNA (adenine1518-N6/adenine1519-N6)-dimethyltransferase
MQKLGQHFLRNKKILNRIVDKVDLENKLDVIEVGPGEGVLTDVILEKINKSSRLFVVEKDRLLAAKLINKFTEEKRVEVVEGDILKDLEEVIKNNKIRSYVVVGNIPYYITGKLLRLMATLNPSPQQIIFLLQKEVGERICSKSPKMNRLAASIQLWAEPQVVGEVSRKYFSPPPQVDSIILKITPYKKPLLTNDEVDKTLKIIFQQPRKTVINNILAAKVLKRGEVEKIFSEYGIPLKVRPQDLSIEEVTRLGKII